MCFTRRACHNCYGAHEQNCDEQRLKTTLVTNKTKRADVPLGSAEVSSSDGKPSVVHETAVPVLVP